MSERRRPGLLPSLAGGVAVWAAGMVVYGVTEVATNTAVGLYQPAHTWALVVLVYAVLGALGGLAAGLAWYVLGRWSREPRPAVVAMATLPPVLLGAEIALPLNDRYLGDLLSVPSLAANLVLAVVCVGLGFVLHRRLAASSGVRLALRYVGATLWIGAFLTVGNYLDVFVTDRIGGAWAVGAFTLLAVLCLGLHAVTERLLGVSARTARFRVVPAAGVLLLSIAAAVRSGASLGTPAGEGTARPSILWIVMDTTRADHLSCYGYPKPTTPHVDEIAADGVLFENAMSQASWTLASHFQMITSRFAAGKEKILDRRFDTAPEMLRARGYRTGAVLANFSLGRRSGFEQGFDTFMDGPVQIFYLKAFEKVPVVKALLALRVLPSDWVLRFLVRRAFIEGEAARADAIGERALDWMAAQGGQPFFMFVNFMDPHDAYDPPSPFRARFAAGVDPELGFVHYNRRLGGEISSNRFVRDELPKLGADGVARLVSLYDAELAFLDAQIGQLVAGLKARGLYDRTIVVVTADHGELLGEHGLFQHFKSLSDEELHVPLVIHYPPALPAGRRVKSLVELTDVLPTLLEMAGVPAPPLDGRSLLPLVADREEAVATREAYSFLVRPPDPKYDFTLAGNLVGRRSPDTKYVWSSTGRHEYYDLGADPRAERNVYGARPEVAAVEQRVAAWRKKVDLEQLDAGGPMDRLTRDRLRALGYVQ
jgi:arylsulfatase A-like enzyme